MGESLVYAIKIAAAVAAAVAFIAGISIFIGLIGNFQFGSIVSEAVKLVSVYLPFRPRGPITALGVVMGGMFAFLATRKIFQLLHVVHKDS